jgi:hypothetical protein
MWIPLACYLGLTLVVPILDGVPLDRGFLGHAAVVLGITLAVGLGFGVARRLCNRRPFPRRPG